MRGVYGFLIAAVFSVFAFCADSLSLKDAVLNTLQNNPKIKEQVHNYRATIEDVKSAKREWYPKLDYLGTIGYEETKNSSTFYDNVDYNVYQHSLILTENIFNGWSTTHQIKTHQARLMAASHHLIEVVNDVSFRIVKYYLEILKNRELLKIAQQNIDINKDIASKVKKLFNGGMTTKSEMEKTLASLELAKSNYIVQENQLKDSIRQFEYYYGKNVDYKILEVPNDNNIKLPLTYEEGLNTTINNNPSILVQKYNIEVAKQDYKEKKSLYYPRVDIELRKSWGRNMGGIEGTDERFSALLKVSYNLFNGLRDKAKIQKGISKINQEVQIKNDLIRQAKEGYDLSWDAYKELAKQLKYLKNYKKYAINTLRLYSKEFDMGRRSVLDLLSAQSDLINSKSQIVKTKYNYMFSKYRILDAMGKMVSSIVGTNDTFKLEAKNDTLPKGYK